MNRRRPEPMQVVKQRRDAALRALVEGVPYIQFLGVTVDRRGDELTALLPFDDKLIGNPLLPAIHGGVTAAFLEVTAQIEVSWAMLWSDLESGALDAEALSSASLPRMPKTIDVTVDYLRSGLPRDAYARARVTRSGRRYATVFVEAWQDNRERPIAQATVHFLMPRKDAATVAAGNACAERRRGRTSFDPPQSAAHRRADCSVECHRADPGGRRYRRRGAVGAGGTHRCGGHRRDYPDGDILGFRFSAHGHQWPCCPSPRCWTPR